MLVRDSGPKVSPQTYRISLCHLGVGTDICTWLAAWEMLTDAEGRKPPTVGCKLLEPILFPHGSKMQGWARCLTPGDPSLHPWTTQLITSWMPGVTRYGSVRRRKGWLKACLVLCTEWPKPVLCHLQSVRSRRTLSKQFLSVRTKMPGLQNVVPPPLTSKTTLDVLQHLSVLHLPQL